MIVTYIFANIPADQIRIQVRCRNMADAINRTGNHRAYLLDMTSFAKNTPLAQKVCGESDLLVIYRYLYGPVLTATQYWKARDKKVIVDFDQSVDHLNPSNPAGLFWYEGFPFEGLDLDEESIIDPPPIEQFKWGLAMVDAATVPSLRLADDWSHYTSIHKVMDYINTHHYPAAHQTHGDEIWIGTGSRVESESLEDSGLLTAMESICLNHPRVKFVLSGMDKIEAAKIDEDQLMFFAPENFEDWVNILLTLDIGLMPIQGDYDRRLGSYDLLEFMIAKIPWIASKEPTFHNIFQYGQWVANTPEEWEKVILDTVDQLEAHQQKAVGEPFLFALNQDISVNISKILKIYEEIIPR